MGPQRKRARENENSRAPCAAHCPGDRLPLAPAAHRRSPARYGPLPSAIHKKSATAPPHRRGEGPAITRRSLAGHSPRIGVCCARAEREACEAVHHPNPTAPAQPPGFLLCDITKSRSPAVQATRPPWNSRPTRHVRTPDLPDSLAARISPSRQALWHAKRTLTQYGSDAVIC